MNEAELRQEEAWLERVFTEANAQYQEASVRDDALKDDAVDTQRELWEDVGSIAASDGLDKLVDFLEYINVMKKQKRSHGIIEQQKAKLTKMLRNPYFGRIDFRSNEQADAKPYYIGTFSLITDDNRVLVYDWRAPVSGMFYDNEIGAASFVTPRGTVEGELTKKRQYKIENGKLTYSFDSSVKIDDEMLQQMLAGHADGKMRSIVTTIQREQNRAIRNESYKHLIVQGAAGSGKTSVALHRIAYLLFRHRDTITAENIIVFSPNPVFSDYISNVLPELGEANMLQTTFETFLSGALVTKGRRERYYDLLDYIFSEKQQAGYPARMESLRLKSSPAFRDAIKTYTQALIRERITFAPLVCAGVTIASSLELARLFSYDYASLPYLARFEKLRARMDYLLTNHEAARAAQIAEAITAAEGFIDRGELRRRSRAIAKQESQPARERAHAMTDVSPASIYAAFLGDLANLLPGADAAVCEAVSAYTRETLRAGLLHYEDQIALLFLQGALGGTQKTARIRYVIIDEAQDYTPLQYECIRLFFAQASITMLGDLDQSITPHLSLGGYETIASLFPPEETLLLRFTTSYRSTAEIIAFAGAILNHAGEIDSVGRHGEAPMVACLESEDAVQHAILKDICDLTANGHASIGILTETKAEAKALHHALQEHIPVQALLGGEESFPRGAVVLPAYLAKGLEFDAVILANAGGEHYRDESERLLLYTACTRALHVLRVYCVGEPSPFLPNPSRS
jgi:DNA helicase-2/ATP-dependent DNA helicase PcrA